RKQAEAAFRRVRVNTLPLRPPRIGGKMKSFTAAEGTMAENRLMGADFVRAAACLFVLAHHLTQRVSPDAVDPALHSVFRFGLMGPFGVAAFFVLSGYLLSRPFWLAYDAGAAMPSLRTYAMRRAARILPGYWFALTVT